LADAQASGNIVKGVMLAGEIRARLETVIKSTEWLA
jgi:hypothetical protein